MRLLAGAAFVAAFVSVVPIGTARWVEAQRHNTLQRVSRKTDTQASCPADDSIFALLKRHDAGSDSSNTLWKPVCRKAEPPLGKVAIVADRADVLRQCEDIGFQARMAQCWFDPAIDFLEQPSEARTYARLSVADAEGREVIWETAMPLAWGSNLQWEHRLWLLLVTALAVAVSVLRFSRRRWIEAGTLQRQLGVAAVPLPAGLERLLLCVLPSFNIPQEIDDLRESYADLLSAEGPSAAKRWYRWQVRRSLFHYVRQWNNWLFRGSAARSSTSGR